MANDSIVPYSLDDYFQTTSIGSLDKAIGNNLYGINHKQTPGLVPTNKDTYGLTFFVRPQLNLQSDNVRNMRIMSALLTSNPLTMQRFVRTTLDPRLMAGYRIGQISVPPIDCPVVDNNMAFIPVLTNGLNSISGWPDITVPQYTSEAGLYNESWSIVDGVAVYRETFDIDASFKNTRGDPILYMFYIWLHYQAAVFEGKLVPYMDMITENEIDYNSRIFRLVLDREKRFVTKIAATGPCFPVSVPTGSFFDYNNEKPYNDQNKDITIRFRCMGVDFFDDILIKEFNDTVAIFNPSMSDNLRNTEMRRVYREMYSLFNHRCYPRINPNNNELEWWVHSSIYDSRGSSFFSNNVNTSGNDEETGD